MMNRIYPGRPLFRFVLPWKLPAILVLLLFGVQPAAAQRQMEPKASKTATGSSQTLTSPDQVPEGLAPSDWQSIRAAYEAGQHAFQPLAGESGKWQARNPGQAFTATFDEGGFLARPQGGGWEWGLELKSYGFGDDQKKVERPAAVEAGGQRLTYTRDPSLHEWFLNDQRGLEHGFTLFDRPASESSGLPLELTLGVRGGLRPQLTADAQGVDFKDASGATAITYAGLKVWDKDGKTLPSRFEAGSAVQGGATLRISVDERGARYPLFIDPLAQQAFLKASNPGVEDLFGFSVSVSGDTVVVGAYWEDSSTTGVNSTPDESAARSGAAYVFVRSGTSWTQQAYLKASNSGGGDGFGYSVSVSGDTAVVGAYLEDSSTTGVNSTPDESAEDSGAAYVFVRNGTLWTEQAYLKASNAGGGDRFGTSASVSGDTVVVGAEWEDSSSSGVNSTPNESAADSGAAYVFVRSGTMWTEQAYLKASNAEGEDLFGVSVSVSGDTLVVGAQWEDSSTAGVNSTPNESAGGSGAAYVFVRSGTVWTEQAYLKASNTGGGDRFGVSVSVAGDTVVVGAFLEASSSTGVNSTPNESGVNSGAAYVFVRSGPLWTQQAYLKASNTGVADGFGYSVSVSGDTVVVGASGEASSTTGVNSTPNESAYQSGAAYVFVRSGTLWTQQAYLKASSSGAGDRFGYSVSVSGDTVLVGAPAEDSSTTGVNSTPNESAWNSGAAYVFVGIPEIGVTGNGMNIVDGASTPNAIDQTDFGSASVVSGTVVRAFTVANLGRVELTLGSVTVGGDHAADFRITTPPASTVAAGGSTMFQVTFDPSAPGLRSATLSFANNDADEDPFNFTVQGTGVSVPGAPTIGTAIAGNTTVSVTFSAPASNGGSPITNYTATCGTQSTSGATSPIAVTGLPNGTPVTCSVLATNAVGNGPSSAASNSVTPATVPGAPTIGTATGGNTSVSVTFTAPASNGGSPLTGFTATCGTQSTSGATSPITVTGLTNGTPVTCTVLATNAIGNGPSSAASNSVTPATVPGAPTIGMATGGNTTVSVTFTAPVSDGGSPITGYTATCGAQSAFGATSPITVTGLTNGTPVTCRVQATNVVGNSPSSAVSNSVTPATMPGAPAIGTAIAGNTTVSVTFTAPASNGGSPITDYTATCGTQSTSGATSPITVTGLTNGTSVTCTVLATNAVGNGPSSAVSNSVTPATVPGAPAIGTAIAGNTTVSVTFTAPASNGGSPITGYTATCGVQSASGTTSPITVTGLTNGTPVTCTVVATNALGNSPSSAASNSVTPATVPGAPNIGTAIAGNTTVSVTFTAPASDGGSPITGYTATCGAQSASGTTSPITVTGLPNGLPVTCTVAATNTVGNGPSSAASNSVTPATPGIRVPASTAVREGDAVSIPVELLPAGLSLSAVSASLDYDQTCLTPDADNNGVLDQVTWSAPASFSRSVTFNALDTDGEIDFSIFDFNPPIAALPAGVLVQIQFQAICPVPGTEVAAPIVFSSAPSPSFGDVLANNVVGDWTNGVVRILGGPAGDCNNDNLIGAADLTAIGLEIFDGDGEFWLDAPQPTYPGSPVGCDANASTLIQAADVTCANLLIFGGTCSTRAAVVSAPLLEVSTHFEAPLVWLRARLQPNNSAVGSLAFSFDLDRNLFDLAQVDLNHDGRIDHVRFPQGEPDLAMVRWDPNDPDGEMDFLLADLSQQQLAEGILVEVGIPAAQPQSRGLFFSAAPAPSFGSTTGSDLPGIAVEGLLLFMDGFESGETERWSGTFLASAIATTVPNEASHDPGSYRGRFTIDPALFAGIEAGKETTRVFAVKESRDALSRFGMVVTWDGAGYQIRGWAQGGADGTLRRTPPVVLRQRPSELRFEWSDASGPGAQDGWLRIFADGVFAGVLDELGSVH